jgi:hypothetical protein
MGSHHGGSRPGGDSDAHTAHWHTCYSSKLESRLIGSAYPCSAQTAQTQVSGRTGFASDSHFASLLAAESPDRRPRALRFHYLTGTFGYAFVIPSSVPSLTR